VTDIFRYEAHAVEETPFPTDGHDEVLVWVDTVADVPPGSSTAIDASDLVVVDHSPSTYGAEPPLVERTLSLQANAQGNFGFPRISRQRAILAQYRALEQDNMVEMIAQQVSKSA